MSIIYVFIVLSEDRVMIVLRKEDNVGDGISEEVYLFLQM